MMGSAAPRRAWVESLMGTVVSIHVIGDACDDPATAAAVAGCFAELRELERIFSPFRDDSDISRIRRGELDLAAADPRVAVVESACRHVAQETGGLFSAWWKGWFDPTGYVKGWAVDEAATHHLDELLARVGVEAVGINAGGDMRLRTAPGSGWSWHVGIADPDEPGAVLATLDVRDGAVATSGTAERGAHIVDPRTGRPATGARSVTVVADELTEADVWATAGVVAGDDLAWTARAPRTRGLVVGADRSIRRWIGGLEVAVHAA